MSELPASEASLPVPTDFTNESAWVALIRVLSRDTADGLRATVEIVDDEQWRNTAPDARRGAIPVFSSAAVQLASDGVFRGFPGNTSEFAQL